MSFLDLLGISNTAKYAQKINDLKNANIKLSEEKRGLQKQLDVMVKVKQDLESVMAGYMATIDKQNSQLETYRQTDLKLTEREKDILTAARNNQAIYTVYFPDGSVATVAVSKDILNPSKEAVRLGGKKLNIPRAKQTGTRTTRWEL